MSETDLNKLKVTELREELKKRGIDTKGNKAQLVQKLRKAIREERKEGGESEEADDIALEGDSSQPIDSSQNESGLDLSQNESGLESSQIEVKELGAKEDIKLAEIQEFMKIPQREEMPIEAVPEEQQLLTGTEEFNSEPSENVDMAVKEESSVTEASATAEPILTEFSTSRESLDKPDTADVTSKVAAETMVTELKNEENKGVHLTAANVGDTHVELLDMENKDLVKDSSSDLEILEEKMVESKEGEQDMEIMETDENAEIKEKMLEAGEKFVTDEENKVDSEFVKERRGEKRHRSRSRSRSRSCSGSEDRYRSYRSRSKSPKRGRHSRSRSRSHSRSRSRDRSRSRERRHYRSRSRSQDRQHNLSRSPDRTVVEPSENEDWLLSTAVQLDRYNCDLSLTVDDSGMKATPLVDDGFAYMWHGIRATYGINKGKVGFEVKIVENLNVDHLPPEEDSKHVARIGFSTDTASTQLGEEQFSYGYGGTGKASTECKFVDYGMTFTAGDVIGAYIDFENNPIVISYSKNGEDLGTCFEIISETLSEQALFPHILTKNCSFECNFGQLEEPFFPIKENFFFINAIQEDERVRGTLPPAKKEECEMVMMCGLPGAGKTSWANKHVETNPDKRYNILGTNALIDKMKVMGLPRKRNYAGRWDVLIGLCSKCLDTCLMLAARKKRNYILDQTNVYPSAQRRKMRPFEGFQRTAVVIVPTDEEFKRRCEQREKDEGKEVPDSAVLEMKANFKIPAEGFLFDKVEYVELQKEEAETLVDQYNREGKILFPGGNRRFQGNDRNQSYDSRSNRSYGSYGGGQDRGRDYQRSWGYNNRRGTGSGSGGGGGYNNRDNRDGGGYNRRGGNRDGGYYRRNDRGGGGSGYNQYNQQDRRRDQSWSGGGYRDRRDNRGGGRDNNWTSNRNSGYQSSWKSHNQGSGNRSYGQQSQGSWGNQGVSNTGSSWGAANTGAGGWGTQQDWSQQQHTGYQPATWGQWTAYSQPQQQQLQQQPQQQQAAWNQQYWNTWGAYNQQAQPGGWDYSQYSTQQGGAQK